MTTLPARPTITASPAPTVRIDQVEAPVLSVVVVAFGTGRALIETLASIARATADSGLDVEVIVVSNRHPDLGRRSAVEVDLFTEGIRSVEADHNFGFGGGCELGAMFARAELLAFVNPDVTVDTGVLESLIDAVRASDTPTLAAPVLVDPDGSVQEAGQRLLPSGNTVAITERPAAGAVVDVDYASAACWVISRLDWERVGGFDPAYHPAYFEDVDLALRFRRAGGRCVVVGDAAIVHFRGGGTPDVAPPATAQRDVLMSRWPEIAWRQPV
jgi:GT2 family glycosyltransferase